MKILNAVLATVLLMASTVGQAQEQATASVPKEFPSVGADREAILALLDNYTMAVSTKNQALFETLLLNKEIPFASAGTAIKNNGAVVTCSGFPRQ